MASNANVHRHYHVGNCIKSIFSGIFTEYETQKIVSIRSRKFAILLRTTQIIIFLYSILYLLIYQKGYQKHDTSIISSVTIKVKGVSYIHPFDNLTLIIDAADYIIPPSENNAVFIMTNFIQTHQTRTKCPESKEVTGAVCRDDSDCSNKSFTSNMNGRWTGRCILLNETNDSSNRTGLCEYSGWCPPEDSHAPTMFANDTPTYTIFIKNFIEFPTFGVKHKNLVDELKPCIFHPQQNPDCPIFTLSYILSQAETDEKERDLMLHHGGVIRIKIDWDCNLDRGIKSCKPKYSFARLDVPFREKAFSMGFNFRFVNSWKHNDEHFRTLTKAYGLRLILAVSGQAGKFDFITLTFNIGSLIGIFGMATFLCDTILLNVSRKAEIYRNLVVEQVDSQSSANKTIKEFARQIQQTSLNIDSKVSFNRAHKSLYSTPCNSIATLENVVFLHPLSTDNPDEN